MDSKIYNLVIAVGNTLTIPKILSEKAVIMNMTLAVKTGIIPGISSKNAVLRNLSVTKKTGTLSPVLSNTSKISNLTLSLDKAEPAEIIIGDSSLRI